MSEGAGTDEADGTSRSQTQPEQPPRVAMSRQDDERWALDEHGVWRERRAILRTAPPRSRRKFGIPGRTAVAVSAAIALAAALVVTGVLVSNTPAPGFHPTATKPALAAKQTAAVFLAAWQDGHIRKAASYTNHPAAAAAALTSYRDGLHLHALHLAARSATAAGDVAFSAAATVGLAANPSVTAIWSYGSHLIAYSQDGGWWVRWDPALVAPSLTAGEKVASVPVVPGAAEVLDTAGGNLQNSSDPGLRNIAAALIKSAPDNHGTPGIEVALTSPASTSVAGTHVAGSTHLLRQPVAADVKTTIDPTVEAAAQSAVQGHPDSSMVVLQPSTGDILAVANNAGGNDFALTARVAPGSTNKIITSTALLTTGLVSSPSQPVECPPQVDADGEVINNAGGESEPAGTPFLTDFAASCNNAFDRWYSSLSPQTLAQTAQKYYGLNLPWNIGIGSAVPYYTIPPDASNAELALELFGQGRLETAPLAMASVAATVDTGSFKQPIVVPGQPQSAATPLPASVHQDLWQLMRAVTQPGGTAAGVFDGVSSPVYAKTGTADVSGQGQPNSWIVAFDPTLNVAVGCLVLNAGYGAQVAGPEAANLLQSLQSGA
jgi:hypothetical protein